MKEYQANPGKLLFYQLVLLQEAADFVLSKTSLKILTAVLLQLLCFRSSMQDQNLFITLKRKAAIYYKFQNRGGHVHALVFRHEKVQQSGEICCGIKIDSKTFFAALPQ